MQLSRRHWPLLVVFLPLFVQASEHSSRVDKPVDETRFYDNVPVVLTPARLRQSKADTPATVTIIEGHLIKQLGILNLYEVFRLVPGMTVGFVESNVPVVSYHGTVANDQRRLQVLIDGRSMYNSNLANVDWHNMPVPLENIQRIEVSRGPNAASYGANSFLAIINIMTKSPEDSQGAYFHTIDGSNDFTNYYGSFGAKFEKYDLRLSFSKRESDGFDFRYTNPEDGSDSNVRQPFNDGYNIRTVNYDSTLHLTPNQSLVLNGAYNDSLEEVDPQQFGEAFGVQGEPNKKGKDYYGQMKWEYHFSYDHFLHFQVYYQHRERDQAWHSEINPAIVGVNIPFTLGLDVNQNIDQQRVDYEIQDTLTVSPELRVVLGTSYREDTIDSETYFNGQYKNYFYRLYGSAEYHPLDPVTFNLGAMWETDSDNGDYLSPRAAINYHFNEHHTLRFILSKAVRTPDTFEQSGDWGYTARNVSPAIFNSLEGERVISTQAPGGLKEEQILSREISYFGQFLVPNGTLSAEIKYFYDTITDLISGRINPTQWDLENNVKLTHQGVELEASYRFYRNYFRLGYGYLDQDGEYTGTAIDPVTQPMQALRLVDLESRLTAQHTGSVVWVHNFPYKVDSALTYTIADQLNHWDYQRLDLRIAKSIQLVNSSLEFSVIYHHYINSDPILHRDNNIADQNHWFMEASVNF